jgi:hypothetical protein
MGLFGGSDKEPYVFISYRRRGLDAVRALADALDAAFGDDHVFFDIADIHAGARWEALLNTQVLAADVVIAAMTETWVSEFGARTPESDFVVRELSLALEEGIPVVPVVFPGVPIPTPDQIPLELQKVLSYQGISLDHLAWSERVQRLIESMRLAAAPREADSRKRKVNEAALVAMWFASAEPDERILARAGGTQESGLGVVVSGRRIFIARPDGRETPIETATSNLFAVRRDRGRLWVVGLDFEAELQRLDEVANSNVADALKSLEKDLDVAEGPPDDELRRQRRIRRARLHVGIKDDLLATAGEKREDASIFVRPHETTIVRHRDRQLGSVSVAHNALGAVCTHRGSIWLLSPDGEQRVDHLPVGDIDRFILLLREHAPNAPVYRKSPDRQVRESLMMLDPAGIAAKNGIDLSWTKRLRPTSEEAVVLAVSKLHLMESDLASDPDWDDRVEKRKTVNAYVRALVSAFAGEVDEREKPLSSLGDLRKCARGNGWSDRIRATLGSFDPEDARRVLLDDDFLTALLGSVERRDRALVLLVELAAFYPWAPNVKFEEGSRERACERITQAMSTSVSTRDFSFIDSQLNERAKKLEDKGVNWRRLVPLIVGGTALGIITGGAAAPLIGTAIGGAMGLSGAAATSAGLALLGGGSLAAGGPGMAGGMALVGTLGGLVGAGTGLAGNKAIDISKEGLLTESVKLDLLSELVLLEERKEARQVASIVELLSAQTGDLETQLDALKNQSDTSSGITAGIRKTAKDLVAKADKEIEDLRDRLSILRTLEDRLSIHLTNFIENTRDWIEEGNEAVELVKEQSPPTLLIAIEAAERVSEVAERIPGIVPALLVNEEGKTVASVVVDVMTGQTRVEGEDALRARGVKSEFLAEAGGVLLDVVAHPLVWASATALVVGAHSTPSAFAKALTDKALVLPAGLASEWLVRTGLEFPKLAKGVVKIIERELREVVGEAAIDLAEGVGAGLRLKLDKSALASPG